MRSVRWWPIDVCDIMPAVSNCKAFLQRAATTRPKNLMIEVLRWPLPSILPIAPPPGSWFVAPARCPKGFSRRRRVQAYRGPTKEHIALWNAPSDAPTTVPPLVPVRYRASERANVRASSVDTGHGLLARPWAIQQLCIVTTHYVAGTGRPSASLMRLTTGGRASSSRRCRHGRCFPTHDPDAFMHPFPVRDTAVWTRETLRPPATPLDFERVG